MRHRHEFGQDVVGSGIGTGSEPDRDADAAVDPLSRPEVKAAVARATFEVLVGFQLTQDQLTYNATR